MQHSLFPEETLRGKLRVVLSGRERALVERHRGIISYTPDCVTVRLKDGYLRIHGKSLQIGEFGEEDMTVLGEILSLELSRP